MSRDPQDIVPVLDLREGQVVLGIAGRRDEYRPIVSPWSRNANPVEIFRGIRSEWGLSEIYVADLDAIQFERPNENVYRDLLDVGATLLVDAGIRGVSDAMTLIRAGIDRVIVALETLESQTLLHEYVAQIGPERLIFSLDLMHGKPMLPSEWGSRTPLEIVTQVVDAGIQSLIVLDLAGVGVGEGIPSLPLCREIRQHWPTLEIITGGGVRGASDVASAIDHGASAVLVASALHDRRLTPESLTTLPGIPE